MIKPLSNRIEFTNNPTFGTMWDRELNKMTYAWIGENVPQEMYFFCKFVNDNQGLTLTVMVTVTAYGVVIGTYNILDPRPDFFELIKKVVPPTPPVPPVSGGYFVPGYFVDGYFANS